MVTWCLEQCPLLPSLLRVSFKREFIVQCASSVSNTVAIFYRTPLVRRAGIPLWLEEQESPQTKKSMAKN